MNLQERMCARLFEDGFVVLPSAFAQDDVHKRLCALFGASDYQTLECQLDDEDLALGASRTNFRLTERKNGCLLSPTLTQLLAGVAAQWEWYDASIITAIPGAGRQPKHRDYGMPETGDGDWKLVVFTPITDVVSHGGATCVYKGTHFGSTRGNLQRVHLKAGDALVFFSSLLHYGAANTTDTPRILLSQTFTVRGPAFAHAFAKYTRS